MDRKYQFTVDTFSRCEKTWPAIFNLIKWDPERDCRVVEIGSYEGRATVWILENLIRHPQSKVYCIDPFMPTGRKDKEVCRKVNIDWDQVRQRFQSNLALTGKAGQVELLRQPSAIALSSLLAVEFGRVDFVYVDGSHRAPDVLSDLIFSYHLLKDGGLMICDDYIWRLEARIPEIDVLHNPKISIDAFFNIFRRCLIPVLGLPINQMAFVKQHDE
jgi:predicted O-methyltransferase YrrM